MNIKEPLYIIIAKPLNNCKINNFFSADVGGVKHMLEHPSGLRYAGWDLETLDNAKLVKGEYYEVINGDRKKIRLYEDGTLIMKVSANQNFLGWGRSPDNFLKSPRLNPVALIEITYNFVYFYSKLINFFNNESRDIKFVIQFRDTFLSENKKLYLNPYGTDSLNFAFDDYPQESPEDFMEKDTLFLSQEIVNNSAKCSYELIKKVYNWFGITDEKIPLKIKDENGFDVIDIEKIKKM